MNNLKILEQVAYWWVKVACYVALLMPFIFLPWVIYPYIFGKIIFLVTVLMTALPWYVFLIARRPEFRPKKSLLMYGLGVYFLVTFLATVFSFDPYRSFWSYPERMIGFWTLLHFLLFFFMCSSVFRSWGEWKKLLGFSVGVSIALSLVAFIQRVSPETVLQSTGARTGSFMNNPIFFAAYLLFNLGFTALIFQKSNRFSAKLMWALFFVMQFVAFLYTGTRGALVGLYLGTAIFLLIYALLHQNKKIKKIALTVFLVIIVASLGAWFVRGQDWVRGVPGFNRFYNFSFTGGTVETRLIAWEIALQGFQDRPILGWGPENYFYAFNKFYNPRSLEFSFYETWFDHAHNQVLDQLNNTGIVGTLGYFTFFVLIVWQLIRLKKKQVLDVTTFAISVAILTAYFVQNLFIFDQPSSLIMFYLCLAWWQSYATPGAERAAEQEVAKKVWIKGYGTGVAVLGVLVLTCLTIWYMFCFKPAFASSWVRNGVIAASSDIEFASQAFEKGLQIKNQYPDMVPLYYAREVAGYSRNFDEPDEAFISKLERAYEQLSNVLPQHPANIYALYLLSLTQVELAKVDTAHYKQAMADIDKAIEYSPDRQQLRYVKGKIYLFQGDYDEAVAYFKETVDLDLNISESWWNLGIAQYQAGSLDDAVESFNKCMEIGGHPSNLAEAMALVEVFSQKRDLDKVIELYLKAIGYEPENGRLYAALAAGYLEAGEFDKAREAAEIAKSLEPALSAETETFLEIVDFKENEAMNATLSEE
ncbi:O-antigen ligase family protein [Patescibacteria group bacterium]|nr:O-antigen ligase family protein [Patescibacteria group bacterium]MBU1921712.1 O-antigen ligase family protein [Patescibacteria group bacterium]